MLILETRKLNLMEVLPTGHHTEWQFSSPEATFFSLYYVASFLPTGAQNVFSKTNGWEAWQICGSIFPSLGL